MRIPTLRTLLATGVSRASIGFGWALGQIVTWSIRAQWIKTGVWVVLAVCWYFVARMYLEQLIRRGHRV